MAYIKYCDDCDELFHPTGRYCRYCKECREKRINKAKVKTKGFNFKAYYLTL